MARARVRYLLQYCVSLALAFALFSSSTRGAGPANNIVVLYPSLGSEYDTVFQSIADGIKERSGAPLLRIPLPREFSKEDVARQLNGGNSAKSVVALGRRGLEATQKVDWRGPLVLGALIWDPTLADKKYSAIYLDPDPRLVLNYLKLLAPRIKRVYLVIEESRGRWLSERTNTAASDLGISVIVKAVTNRRDSALAYRDILSRIDGTQEALWLPFDPDTVDETTVQLVLRAAWDRRFIAFSGTSDHAQRGALFSVIPDYAAVGGHLADLLQTQANGEPTTGARPNSHLRLAVNMRTARHLGLEFNRETEAKIGVVFK